MYHKIHGDIVVMMIIGKVNYKVISLFFFLKNKYCLKKNVHDFIAQNFSCDYCVCCMSPDHLFYELYGDTVGNVIHHLVLKKVKKN